MHAEHVEGQSCSVPELPLVEPSLTRRIDDLLNELAYIDAYPERWDSQPARITRRAVVLTEIRYCRSMLPRAERRRFL